MRIWVRRCDDAVEVNFLPETEEEGHMFDKIFGYVRWRERPIGDKCRLEIGNGAEQIATLGGHERQRWIIIYEKAVPADTKSGVFEL